MALLYIDGFDGYGTLADMAERWTITNSAMIVGDPYGRNGRGLQLIINNRVERPLGSNLSTIIVGMAAQLDSTNSNDVVPMFMLVETATIQCSLFLRRDGSLRVARGNFSAADIVTTDAGVVPNVYTAFNYIEAKITLSNTVGAIVLKVNGVEVLNQTGLDTCSNANEYANIFYLGTNQNSTGSCRVKVDDLYICDTSGASLNDFLGDVRVDRAFMDTDGPEEDFDPLTGSTKFYLVNDYSDGGTLDAVAGDTMNQKQTFGIEGNSVPPLTTEGILSVQVTAMAFEGTSGTYEVATLVKQGTSEATGATTALDDALGKLRPVTSVQNTDPSTGAAWTRDGLLSASFGVKIVSKA